jgi:hypothetical protein
VNKKSYLDMIDIFVRIDSEGPAVERTVEENEELPKREMHHQAVRCGGGFRGLTQLYFWEETFFPSVELDAKKPRVRHKKYESGKRLARSC